MVRTGNQRAILQIRINGLGSEKRTAIFPKLIFSIRRGVNLAPTDPNYDIKELALECATKRMYPDILNYDKLVELTGNFKVPMGCRSFLQGWKNERGEEVNVGPDESRRRNIEYSSDRLRSKW